MVLPALVDEDATRVVLAFLDRAALGRFAATSEAADALVDDAPWEALYLDDVGRPRAAATRARPPAWWRRKTRVWRALSRGLALRRVRPGAYLPLGLGGLAAAPLGDGVVLQGGAARGFLFSDRCWFWAGGKIREQAGYCPRGAATDGAGRSAPRAAKESEIPNFKGSYLGRFPLGLADFWTSDHLLERSRSVDAFSGTLARGTLKLKRT
ncbi:hypothetical protein AURANDRAFT_61073 [Aureococcus anophagefferens]|uniref:F-box domain-containing protein n=1 Tax=Aureococcus anophagefferens TaxID=44056 RepID=F0XYY9_AURAN|nr:hypothetical protein AURANDRAFT_61073 [Aureococcus anophagefferens]EGB11847.1 hypothetical protein AURANDRAFT_61073 [Aureococcus anophagefferens]|eukprot:XP_009032969.1 hypothetical protein AURANDRAFT_61073 [Aureococcus anophagefferens]